MSTTSVEMTARVREHTADVEVGGRVQRLTATNLDGLRAAVLERAAAIAAASGSPVELVITGTESDTVLVEPPTRALTTTGHGPRRLSLAPAPTHTEPATTSAAVVEPAPLKTAPAPRRRLEAQPWALYGGLAAAVALVATVIVVVLVTTNQSGTPSPQPAAAPATPTATGPAAAASTMAPRPRPAKEPAVTAVGAKNTVTLRVRWPAMPSTGKHTLRVVLTPKAGPTQSTLVTMTGDRARHVFSHVGAGIAHWSVVVKHHRGAALRGRVAITGKPWTAPVTPASPPPVISPSSGSTSSTTSGSSTSRPPVHHHHPAPPNIPKSPIGGHKK